jgi:hypothetical protein
VLGYIRRNNSKHSWAGCETVECHLHADHPLDALNQLQEQRRRDWGGIAAEKGPAVQDSTVFPNADVAFGNVQNGFVLGKMLVQKRHCFTAGFAFVRVVVHKH